MRRTKAAVLAALVVTVGAVLVCAFTLPGAERGPAPRARHVAPDGRALVRDGTPTGGDTLLAGAAMVALGAGLALAVLVRNRPRQRAG
ncbi:hypothetical protein GO001_08345 [Streptomyces sp. NRRL B-1677]|uniref:hypothetical protein n=1 Tax=Streptomyces TaxID=1883 RepID=UPI001892CDB6|nr:hypothetical protein [Streptomyces sp. NRRL B-1677]MBF6045232.1 hypothetical protein [Streptomyces sp. NRRL B-1677]